uniref:Uncharacterized protein n=1 Tax=Anguilla anguilla TaxID=7936 RepID=A0A0E9VEG3_ANGAN
MDIFSLYPIEQVSIVSFEVMSYHEKLSFGRVKQSV